MQPKTEREHAHIELLRSAVRDEQPLDSAFEKALRLASRTLRIGRVGLWIFEDQLRRLRCRLVYDHTIDSYSSGETLDLDVCPTYGAAIRERRAVVAEDARRDPRTRELSHYLTSFGIGAILDSPVFVRGEIIGVVCHEHVGGRREFSPHDVDFAATVGDMLGLYIEQERSRTLYRSLLETRNELEKARVMEALGRMARAVGHDFNNVLAAIRLVIDGLERRDKKDAPLGIDVVAREVAALVDQGARLSRQLLTFARSEHPSSKDADLVATIRGMEPLLRTLERDGLDVAVSLPDEACVVPTDRARVEQLVMNLAVNSRDAMPGGGKLTIEVTAPALDAGATLRVIDTGVGMDESTMGHVFEPFFTTKPRGEGTGLGLATVYGIVTESGGTIDVYSVLGAGTEFVVRWDAASGAS